MWSNLVQAAAPPAPPPQPQPPTQVVNNDNSGVDAWDEDDILNDEIFDDVNVDNEGEEETEGVGISNDNYVAPEAQKTTNGWDDDNFLSMDVPPKNDHKQQPHEAESKTTGKLGLGRAAENFGAALLAQIDNDDIDLQPTNDNNNNNVGGFGGGFVMKGLSRFIEAATAPQEVEQQIDKEDKLLANEDVVVADGENGGWDDDDDLDFHDDEDADVAGEAVEIGQDAVEESSTLLSKVDEPPLQDEPTIEMGTTGNNETGEGWDDIDISFNTPEHKSNITSNTKDTVAVDSGKSSNHGVSDSIKDLVAQTESTLDAEFATNMWKTPPPKGMLASNQNDELNDDSSSSDDYEFQEVSKGSALVEQQPVTADDYKFQEVEEQPLATDDVIEAKEDGSAVEKDASQSLTDFVDTLDAELNKVTLDTQPMAVKAISAADSAYNYDENKDDSPEPLEPQRPTATSKINLPHQESWYINAMEDGKGGVVYGEEALELETPNLQPQAKGQIIPDNSMSGSDAQSSPTVGMPLSELPSEIPSSSNSDNGDTSYTLKQSELQCKCLELIMPLPNGRDGNDASQQESGFGTKKLPDGSLVLVNYEQLLQNEAEKRILLQRSVEAYEHTVKTLQNKYQSSMSTSQEQEIQLASAQNEISELKEMVMRLQDEKENMINETQLFEAELASAVNDKEYLEREVETIQQDMKAKADYYLKNVELQKNIEMKLQESEAEKILLIDQVEMLQSDLSEVQTERDGLNDKVQDLMNAATETESTAPVTEELTSLIESLQQELQEKNNEIESITNNINAPPPEDDNINLREEYNLLQQHFSDAKSTLARVHDENESLRSSQREYEAQIFELKTTIESLDDSGEVDKLAAEVASLTYELGIKTTECEESSSALNELQTKLDNAEARIVEYSDAEEERKHSTSEVEQSLRVENGLLKKQLEDLQGACTLLDTSLEDRAATIQSLEAQIQSLNTQLAETSNLQEELSQMRTKMQALQIKLDDAEARLAAYNVTAEVNDSSEIEQSLSKQLADLRGAYSVLEGQKIHLETSLEERSSAVESLKSQVQGLNAKVTQASNLRGELSRVKKSLDDKSSSFEQLKTELLNTQSDRDVIIQKNQENANKAQEQIARLNSQVADLLRDHNSTMKNVENQLTSSLQQNTTLQSQCEEYRIKLESAESTIAQYIDQVSKLKGQNLELTTALQMSNMNVSAQETQLEQQEKEASETISQWEARCSALEESGQEVIRQWEERVQSLESTVAVLEGKNSELSTSLQTTKIALEARQLESTEGDSKVKKLQKSIESMKLEMDSIAHRHQELLDKNHCLMQEKADITKSLNEQLQGLKERNAQLEDKLFEASFDSPEGERLVQENSSLRKERDELKEQTLVLTERINDLSSRADNIAVGDNTSEKLVELRDELSTLHEERQQLDLDNEELLVQLGLMQQAKCENQEEYELEIETLREQVHTLNDQCQKLQNELNEARRHSIPGESKHNDLKILQDEKDSLLEKISQMSGENQSLIDQISGLAARNETGDDDNVNQEEIQSLQHKLGLLEMKLADKEEEVETTKKQMQHQLNSRDLDIFKLTNECAAKENELKEVSSKLDTANNEMGTFSSKLEALQSQYEQQQYDQSHVVGTAEEEKLFEDNVDDISLQDLLAEAVLDSDDYLRSQIVVLAQALQRSELQRADALERIFTERKTNADSIRQLGESVKRFYTQVK